MTPSEYTQFREAIQTDHPDLYQYLPDRFDLLRWQEFVVRLLEKFGDLAIAQKITTTNHEYHIAYLKDEVDYWKAKCQALEKK